MVAGSPKQQPSFMTWAVLSILKNTGCLETLNLKTTLYLEKKILQNTDVLSRLPCGKKL